MTARRVLFVAGVVTGAAVLSTCGSDPQEPPATPGWVNVTLTTPNTNDGGIVFIVSGATVDSVRSTFSNAFTRRESATQVRGVVIGPLRDGIVVAQVLVPDVGDVSGYSATVTEIAAQAPSFAQRSVADYSLTVNSVQ